MNLAPQSLRSCPRGAPPGLGRPGAGPFPRYAGTTGRRSV